MEKINKDVLRDLIVNELKSMIDEETLLDPRITSNTGTGTLKPHHHNHHISKQHHKKPSYMAKPQLEKISVYAKKLHDMICDGEQLDDWMESHIAQMSDDISEVYHSLDYKKNKK